MAVYRNGNEFSDLPFSAEQMQRDLGRLQQPAAPISPLSSVPEPKPLGTKVSVARDTPDPSGGGIASPLTESAASTRTYWAGSYITTSDGLFAWPAVKAMRFTDANGREVQIVFAEPA